MGSPVERLPVQLNVSLSCDTAAVFEEVYLRVTLTFAPGCRAAAVDTFTEVGGRGKVHIGRPEEHFTSLEYPHDAIGLEQCRVVDAAAPRQFCVNVPLHRYGKFASPGVYYVRASFGCEGLLPAGYGDFTVLSRPMELMITPLRSVAIQHHNDLATTYGSSGGRLVVLPATTTLPLLDTPLSMESLQSTRRAVAQRRWLLQTTSSTDPTIVARSVNIPLSLLDAPFVVPVASPTAEETAGAVSETKPLVEKDRFANSPRRKEEKKKVVVKEEKEGDPSAGSQDPQKVDARLGRAILPSAAIPFKSSPTNERFICWTDEVRPDVVGWLAANDNGVAWGPAASPHGLSRASSVVLLEPVAQPSRGDAQAVLLGSNPGGDSVALSMLTIHSDGSSSYILLNLGAKGRWSVGETSIVWSRDGKAPHWVYYVRRIGDTPQERARSPKRRVDREDDHWEDSDSLFRIQLVSDAQPEEILRLSEDLPFSGDNGGKREILFLRSVGRTVNAIARDGVGNVCVFTLPVDQVTSRPGEARVEPDNLNDSRRGQRKRDARARPQDDRPQDDQAGVPKEPRTHIVPLSAWAQTWVSLVYTAEGLTSMEGPYDATACSDTEVAMLFRRGNPPEDRAPALQSTVPLPQAPPAPDRPVSPGVRKLQSAKSTSKTPRKSSERRSGPKRESSDTSLMHVDDENDGGVRHWAILRGETRADVSSATANQQNPVTTRILSCSAALFLALGVGGDDRESSLAYTRVTPGITLDKSCVYPRGRLRPDQILEERAAIARALEQAALEASSLAASTARRPGGKGERKDPVGSATPAGSKLNSPKRPTTPQRF